MFYRIHPISTTQKFLELRSGCSKVGNCAFRNGGSILFTTCGQTRIPAVSVMFKLGLIGCGKMGGALVRGVVTAFGQDKVQVAMSDVIPQAAEALQAVLTCNTSTGSPAEAAAMAEVLILAVKPHDMEALCRSLGKLKGERLFISIAAGVTLENLESWLGAKQRVIRCMPNTPALVGAGATAFSRGKLVTDADAGLASRVLGSVGNVAEVSERLLDAVTGLSGSGPAYIYTVIEAMADGGVLMGLPRASAVQLAAQTVLGAAKMVLETGKHPAALRDEVTSPGGTTIAGLEQLEAGGLRHALIQAVRAATERAADLGAK